LGTWENWTRKSCYELPTNEQQYDSSFQFAVAESRVTVNKKCEVVKGFPTTES